MECEMRLAASFAPTPDLRTLIREEIRAALAEREEGRFFAPRPELIRHHRV